jgi:hypothetical protein
MAGEKEKKPDEDKKPPKEDKGNETTVEVKDIDADSIIDAFLEENPDLVDLPVEDWPADAIKMLKDTFNSEHVDAPNGVLPDEESPEGAPVGAPSEADEGAPEVNEGEGAPDPEQDFDIAELAKLVEAGDKDGAWDMLQNMFGVSPTGVEGPTNALDRMTPASSSGGGNALAKLISGLKF